MVHTHTDTWLVKFLVEQSVHHERELTIQSAYAVFGDMAQGSRSIEVDVPEALEKHNLRGEMTSSTDWQDILAPLLPRNTSSRLSDKDMVDIISAAAVAAELQLKNGGLVDLLNRARDAALAGSFESARIAALGILEFHQAVQQRRGQPSLISTDPTGAICALSAVTLS